MSYIVCAGVVFIILQILIFCFVMPRVIDRRISAYENNLMERQLEEVRSTYQEMRGWRHDYRNHMQVMKVYLEQGEWEKCGEYLQEMNRSLINVDLTVKTGNVMADAILNSKLAMARSKNITLDVTARVPEKMPVSDVDFCIIFANLMDNAIEACEKITDSERRFIRIYIGMFQRQFYISVTNATDQGQRVRRYLSVKGEGHGLGLPRIDKIVKKSQGYLNRQNEPGVFATEIMIPFI